MVVLLSMSIVSDLAAAVNKKGSGLDIGFFC